MSSAKEKLQVHFDEHADDYMQELLWPVLAAFVTSSGTVGLFVAFAWGLMAAIAATAAATLFVCCCFLTTELTWVFIFRDRKLFHSLNRRYIANMSEEQAGHALARVENF